MTPHFFEAKINSVGYFTFLLPASAALGINSDKILEVSVDYGAALDRDQITANAWAREQNGVIKDLFIRFMLRLEKMNRSASLRN